MKIAFLFLTYGDILFKKQIQEYTENHNIYIHPKFPLQVSSELNKYIINNLIETQWGDLSLVEASVNLLEEAYKNSENEYFILLSSDVYPVHSIEKLESYLEHNTLSIFNKHNSINKYKTSQWWVLNREDAEIILKTKKKYLDFFNSNKTQKIQDGAYDETYFMYVLMHEISDYKYTDMMFCYVSWFENTHQKHPAYFNKMTYQDMKNIDESFFIRKCLPSFDIKTFEPKNNLYVLYIGTETNQNKLMHILDKDYIIITSIDINKINPELLNNCIRIYSIIWKFYYESILDMCVNQNILDQWRNIFITTEKMTFDKIKFEKKKHALGEKHRNFLFKNDKLKKYINRKMFIYAKDKYNNLGFAFKRPYLV